jgi:hypothetical protein
MRALTSKECKSWVEAQGLTYMPYKREVPLAGQFSVEDTSEGRAAAVRAVLSVCERASQILIVVEAHALNRAADRQALDAIRASVGEDRSIDNAPGLLLRREDTATLTELVQLCVGKGCWWSAYLYLAPIKVTLLLWESDIVDLWSERRSDYTLLERELRPTTTS